MNLIRNFVLQDLHAVFMIWIHRVVIMRDLCYCTRKVGNYISGCTNLQFLLKNYQKQLSKLLVDLIIRWFFYRMERLFDDFLVRYYRSFLLLLLLLNLSRNEISFCRYMLGVPISLVSIEIEGIARMNPNRTKCS